MNRNINDFMLQIVAISQSVLDHHLHKYVQKRYRFWKNRKFIQFKFP